MPVTAMAALDRLRDLPPDAPIYRFGRYLYIPSVLQS